MASAPRHDGPRRRAPAGSPPSWAQRLDATRNLPPFLRMVWETHRGYMVGIALLRLLRAFIPIATLWVGKLIVDDVVAASQSGVADWRRLGTLVAIEFGIVALGKGVLSHGYMAPALVGAFGIGIMAGALSLPHGGFEIFWTLIGVSLVALGHDLNRRATY